MAKRRHISNPPAPYQLYYFPIPGKAEGVRVALALSNLIWRDNEIMGEQFAQMKDDGQLPWGMVPILQTPFGTLAESTAILRYIGEIADLTPTDPFQAAKVDEYLDGMEPFSRILSGTFSIEDVDERTKARQAIFNEEGDGTKNLKLLQTKISQSSTGWIANTENMSIADIRAFCGIFGLFSGNFDGIDKSILADYPGLLEYHDKVANEPRITKHYANIAEGSLRWTYQPNAFADLV
ncbi:MAG: glutathione S-transferase [Candidatus Poseidoniaceae archaeon]|nr:glutathione S-transferase [Candidatus Poseidoniaceae archaeon]